MGIAAGALPFLLDEGAALPWSGRLLTLGRQDVSFSAEQLVEAARRAGCTLDQASLSAGTATGEWFFRALGFASVNVMDANPYESADIVFDLNSRDIPDSCRDAFDLVLDGGTLEHVFDVAQALRNLCRMVRPGGRIIHISPLSNCADHGFYSFSPTLFADFYSANAFRVRRISIAQFARDPVNDEWVCVPYVPGALGTLGELSRDVHFVMACAERVDGSTSDVVPQQAYYRNVAWAGRA
jgi:SAM-dependent methyltransferase